MSRPIEETLPIRYFIHHAHLVDRKIKDYYHGDLACRLLQSIDVCSSFYKTTLLFQIAEQKID